MSISSRPARPKRTASEVAKGIKDRVRIQRIHSEPGVPANARLRGWARLALGRRRRAELLIRLVDGPESADLNETYRHKSGPTNVLAFPFAPPPGVTSRLLGDLVICVPVLAREAAEQGKPLAHHWAHIVTHGVLHLRGWDHQTPAAAARMEAKERRLLQRLGIPDPYGAEQPAGPDRA